MIAKQGTGLALYDFGLAATPVSTSHITISDCMPHQTLNAQAPEPPVNLVTHTTAGG